MSQGLTSYELKAGGAHSPLSGPLHSSAWDALIMSSLFEGRELLLCGLNRRPAQAGIDRSAAAFLTMLDTLQWAAARIFHSRAPLHSVAVDLVGEKLAAVAAEG